MRFNIANIIAKRDWSDVGKVFRDIYRQLDELRSARSLENSFIGRGGITIGEDGALTVKDADGHVVAIIGALPESYNRSDGSRQPGIAFYREDGTLAGALADLNPTTPPYKQAWQIFDRAGHVVMADDTNSGKGLAMPWLGGGLHMVDTNLARWPSTTNGTFTPLSHGWYTLMNPPRVGWDIETVCDAGTTGEVKLMVDNNQIGGTQTVGASFIDWYNAQVALATSPNPGDTVYVEIQARVTSGTGAIYAEMTRFLGYQSP